MAALDDTLGAAFLGALAATLLYGVTCVQTFLFFHSSRNDGRRLKLMVWCLWILDTLHIAFIVHGLYFYMVTNFGNFTVLDSPTWTLNIQIYAAVISDVIVQCFFAGRVYILCQRGGRTLVAWVLPLLIITVALLAGGAGFGYASRGFILKTYMKLHSSPTTIAMLYISLGGASIADTIIAVSLCTLFIKSRTGFKPTDSLITSLMAFSINTGLLTSIGDIATLLTYALWPQRFIFIGIYFCVNKLYVNAALASLNARRTLGDRVYKMSTLPSGTTHTGIGFSNGQSNTFITNNEGFTFTTGGSKAETVVAIGRDSDYEYSV